VTYVARNLEPYRGFHVFMRALEKVQRAHPACHAVIVGGDEVSYGRAPKTASSWREHMLGQVQLDPARTHFLGRVPRQRFIEVLQVSAAHVYLTYPFVLSWSLLEAMACGTPIVGSDTPPVREVLRPRENALLVPFHSAGALAAAVLELLAEPKRFAAMRETARRDAQRFDPASALAAYDTLVRG
jgi:glycosyltransferase involved in cell wall biosynthesis